MAEQYLSIKVILDKLLRHPLMQDLSLETAVDYTADFIKIVGMPRIFIEKVVTLNIEKYRAVLPCDYYQVIQIKSSKGGILNPSTDTFFMGKDNKGSSYKIQGNVLYSSIEEGELEMSYLAIHVDEDGFPLVPDNSSFTRALELYIKKQWFTILFDLGKINPAILQNTQQEYAWAVGQAQSSLVRLSIDQMENLTNMWNTLIPRTNEYSRGFATMSKKEHLNI